MPPRDIRYPYPKAVGKGYSFGKIVGRAMIKESYRNWGDYMRILDLVKWKKDGHKKNK